MRHGEGLRREPQSSTIPTPRLTRNYETWKSVYRPGGTYSEHCMMVAPKHTISELHFGNSQTLVTFNIGVSISRPSVCEYTVPSIHIVVDQRSEDGWIHRRSLTSQPIKGETFPDFEMLDARIASALRKIIPNSNFPRRVSVEDQRAQKHDRFYEEGRWLM